MHMTEALKQSERALPRTRDFEERVLDNTGVMYAVALRLTRNAVDARDLTQSAIVKALLLHGTFETGTHMKVWLLTILRNTFIDKYRNTVSRSRSAELSEWAAQGGFGTNDRRETPARSSSVLLELVDHTVRQAVESLPEDFRQVLVLADVEDMSCEEIANAMNYPLGTVMSRLHRARRLLHEHLNEHTKRRRMAGKKGELS